jgi:hypothetical protein
MKPSRRTGRIALCLLFLALTAVIADAATVRGRLSHSNGSPATRIQVTVVNAQGVRSSPAYTGTDGMYYLSNIAPGPYRLEVWVYAGGNPAVYQIRVVEPNTEMPEIHVP